ncbi:cell differentiation protein, putative [Plasmodium vinckei brucechwatti]|uniref:Cell differentiation protein, putative n=1 Tax=Plasmodium vinckei brucechwatti TaxID=119398 RepID=A0A6V7S8T5_PLAVN|nr:cell differentiation protein, putative [Plasmodium vinckei brucechwatti]
MMNDNGLNNSHKMNNTNNSASSSNRSNMFQNRGGINQNATNPNIPIAPSNNIHHINTQGNANNNIVGSGINNYNVNGVNMHNMANNVGMANSKMNNNNNISNTNNNNVNNGEMGMSNNFNNAHVNPGSSIRVAPNDDEEKKKIYQLIFDLCFSEKRESALLELSRKREKYHDIAPVLWNSFGTITTLLQEIVSIYPQLSPPLLTTSSSNRVCNSLALLQCVASHPETKQHFLNAHIPLFLYPFLNAESKNRPFEYLRLTSLGVIGALVKVDNPDVINFLLQTEIIPLCLRIMETGSELSKTVATFIVQKILIDELGLNYICATPERFYAVSTVLSNMVNALVENPSSRLLKHIVRCYLRLSENPRALEALKCCLPDSLKHINKAFIPCLKEDPYTKKWLIQLLYNINNAEQTPNVPNHLNALNNMHIHHVGPQNISTPHPVNSNSHMNNLTKNNYNNIPPNMNDTIMQENNNIKNNNSGNKNNTNNYKDQNNATNVGANSNSNNLSNVPNKSHHSKSGSSNIPTMLSNNSQHANSQNAATPSINNSNNSKTGSTNSDNITKNIAMSGNNNTSSINVGNNIDVSNTSNNAEIETVPTNGSSNAPSTSANADTTVATNSSK